MADTLRPPRPQPRSTVSPILVAEGISKRFGATPALEDVDFRVREGETHALVGRNGAGKSTLVAILTGLEAPDSGTLRFGDEDAPPLADRAAWTTKIACVYQHPMLVPALSVAENLQLNRMVVRRGWIDRKASLRRGRDLLDQWEIDIDPLARAEHLDVAQQQLVEIARALSTGSKLIVLDEPTARLSANGVDRLFERVRALQERGISFVYISHHLNEIYELCQTVTVLRDGHLITSAPVSELPKPDLVHAMVGVDLPPAAARRVAPASGGTVCDVRTLSLPGSFAEVSLRVGAGEVVGLAGLRGCGKEEFAETLAGLRRPGGGEIVLDGRAVAPADVRKRLREGVGFVPPDRHASGFVALASVRENMTMTATSACHGFTRLGFVDGTRQRRTTADLIDELQLVASSPEQPVGELSGGNQQKCVMGRALSTEPSLLVLVQPTAGVDIGSKFALFRSVSQFAENGGAVLIVSDEIDELRECDRVVVMYNGRITDHLATQWTDAELISKMEGADEGVRR